ncbi:hypothetical protein DEO72_LG6g1652 [Vigna unguiculata]|uniref:GIR1-like zinc ribbon domain-containing protein n=1 Tax=Vigna unguiculata TaxID=3917 RepID=A0A4D6M6K1_VIGUN|nr:hypothetical protein DEO72_LG6g1652 [Vigna unguiculata]
MGDRIIESPPDSPKSCVTVELNQEDNNLGNEINNDDVDSFVVLGCSHCLMYIMVSENDLRCPQCKSVALIHFPIVTTKRE